MILYSAVKGKIQNLSEIPDEMFSERIIGNGIAVKPADNWIYSPIRGVVTMVFETKHALGITAEDGTEVLLHIGVDTVNLRGEPFDVYVQVNDPVRQGELLMSSDYRLIESKGYCASVMIIIPNKKVRQLKDQSVTENDAILEVL